jgi:hypothetical protein
MSISTVTSESLQLKLRQLLPSQQGFGTDLSASDTIIPIIDLTSAAEGSEVRESLQSALSFGSQTAFAANNNTVALAATPGFYRIFGATGGITVTTLQMTMSFTITDGSSTKTVWALKGPAGASFSFNATFDFLVFLGSGETVSAVSNGADNFLNGSIRQVADINGTLVQPVGFTPQ